MQTKQELNRNNSAVVARQIERLENLVDRRRGSVATASRDSVEAQISTCLPAQKASAEAALAQVEVDLAKTKVRAGVGAQVEQFTLRVGDIVNRLRRPESSSRRMPDAPSTQALGRSRRR